MPSLEVPLVMLINKHGDIPVKTRFPGSKGKRSYLEEEEVVKYTYLSQKAKSLLFTRYFYFTYPQTPKSPRCFYLQVSELQYKRQIQFPFIHSWVVSEWVISFINYLIIACSI